MKAQIQPLQGRYYGTVIEVIDGACAGQEITLWFASGTPSRRELAAHGYTPEQWEQNALVNFGDCGMVPIRQAEVTCDTHYECAETLRAAEVIVAALDALTPPNASSSPAR